MTSIPSNLTRVPDLLRSSIAMRTLNSTNAGLLRVQQQIATGVDLLRPSDDIVRAAAVGVLDDRLERSSQLQRNLSHAGAALGVLDDILKEAHDATLNAKSIASEQMTAGSSPTERASQAVIIDQILAGLFSTANRQSVAGYALGGSTTTTPPLSLFLSGYRYTGDGPGIVTDLGLASSLPITLGEGNPLTNVSSRIRGSVDLNPTLTADTRLADLKGGRGLGVTLGSVEVLINGTATVQVDLAGSDTVNDVTTRIAAAVRQYETDHGTAVLGAGGVSFAGGSLTVDVASGNTVEFRDITGGTTARDLGLTADTPIVFSPTTATGTDLNPRLTWRTPIAALAGLGGPLGAVQLTNAGRTARVDLSGAATLGDIRNLLEGANLGVRVKINADGSGIDVQNQVAAASSQSLSISEVAGGNSTATRLGIRSLAATTRLSDFNFGRGVQIVDGQNDPTTNSPTTALNTDLRITLGDAAGTVIDIDLRPQDVTTVQALLDRINSEAAAQLAAAGLPTTALVADVNPTTNGIRLSQDASYAGPIRVEPRNNSPAAEQLGLMNGTYDAGSATFVGEDRAKVRTESVFTYLLDLRASLAGNDTRGMALAAADLDTAVGGLVEARGLIGGYAQRVDAATVRETDRNTLDQKARSELRDTDFTKAATRFSLLQTQLQAALQVTARTSGLSLLDFLS